MDSRTLFTVVVAAAALACVSSRAVNISNTWMLPEEGFPVFYRYFRDRISWYEADAVCQFHHANLVTVDSTSEYDAVRAYLKELDITSNVWIGLSKNSEKPRFTWTDFRPLSNDGHWQEAIPVGSSPLCAATDPAADFRWHALPCGGPEVAAFICELPVPSWANGPGGCLLTELPSLTVLYVPEQSALELTSDCGLDGTKRIACKGNADRDEMMRQLSCSITNDDYDDKATKGPIPASTISEITNPSVSPNTKTTKPWIWTSNTIDTGDYGAPTRHRRETENTLSPVSSTRGTTDLMMRDKSTAEEVATTNPSVFTRQTNLANERMATEATATAATLLNDVTLDLSVTQRTDKSPEIGHDSTTQEPGGQPEEQAETFAAAAAAAPTADSKSGDQEEYPGVINQGQLFSIIENGTMFDIIELNETGTEETKDLASASPRDLRRISKPTESTTTTTTAASEAASQTRTAKTFYTTVIYQKEPPEDLTSSAAEREEAKRAPEKQEVTPTFKIYESKTSFSDKGPGKQKTMNDLLTKGDDKSLNREVELFPVISDSSIKLNRTYRKKLPLIENGFGQKETDEDEDLSLVKTDEVPENGIGDGDDDVVIKNDENGSGHKIVEIKLHKEGNKNATGSQLFVTTKIGDKAKRNGKVASPPPPPPSKKAENSTKRDALERFDESSSNNSTADLETEVKETEIDPRLDVLNERPMNASRNNESEIIGVAGAASVEKVQDGGLKKQFLPKPLLEDSGSEEDGKEVVADDPQESASTAVNPTGEPLEPVPQQQPRPNRQRLLTKPQRRSFYPYFFSRVLG